MGPRDDAAYRGKLTKPLTGEVTVCGIVGLFLKEKELYPELGKLLTQMLLTMSDR